MDGIFKFNETSSLKDIKKLEGIILVMTPSITFETAFLASTRT